MSDQPRHSRQEEPWPPYGNQQPAAFQPQPYAGQQFPQPVPGQPGYPQHQWAPQAPIRKKRKVFLWFFLAVQVLFLIWVIGGAATASGQPADCGSLDAATCNAASDAGTAIGVAAIIVFWMITDIILGIIYGVYKLATRN